MKDLKDVIKERIGLKETLPSRAELEDALITQVIGILMENPEKPSLSFTLSNILNRIGRYCEKLPKQFRRKCNDKGLHVRVTGHRANKSPYIYKRIPDVVTFKLVKK